MVSNNAVPGDLTYPVKRGLEDIIYGAASLNPTTKAWFAGARSDRRFQEVTALIAQGKEAKQGLSELVEQTQMAAIQINQVSDPIQKEKLISQLSDSISRYDTGLAQISQKTTQPPATTVEPPSASPAPAVTTPTVATSPEPVAPSRLIIRPQSSAAPQVPAAPSTANVVQPTAVSNPTPQPAFNPTLPLQAGKSDIDRAREMLEGIKEGLEQEKPSQSVNEIKVKQKEQDKREQVDQKDKPEKTDRGSNKNGRKND